MQVRNQIRSSFFAHPTEISAAVCGISTLSFLILSCIELIPLGNNKHNAEDNGDNAQNIYDMALATANAANEKLLEAKKRISDLDCAIAGYQRFNDAVAAFQQRINHSNVTSLERLQLFWQIQFDADKNDVQQSVIQKSWSESAYVYGPYYTCSGCAKSGDCCSQTGYHLGTRVSDYDETTTIANTYKNIIQGTPLQLTPLDCGYYSRHFGTLSPVTYVINESLHIESGDKMEGNTYINFNREYGSRVTCTYDIDGITVNPAINVLHTANQNESAADLAVKLLQFLVSAITAFNSTGANYSAVQNNIRDKIPLLIEIAHTANTTLQQKALVLADKQAELNDVNDQFKEGLSLWLPMLFLIPGTLAALTYLFITVCKVRCTSQDDTQNDIEMGHKKSKGNHQPRLFSSSSSQADSVDGAKRFVQSPT